MRASSQRTQRSWNGGGEGNQVKSVKVDGRRRWLTMLRWIEEGEGRGSRSRRKVAFDATGGKDEEPIQTADCLVTAVYCYGVSSLASHSGLKNNTLHKFQNLTAIEKVRSLCEDLIFVYPTICFQELHTPSNDERKQIFPRRYATLISITMVHKIEPGASLLLAWQLKDRRVVIVGGGEVASHRLLAVLSADATVTLISPRPGLHPVVEELVTTSPRITYHDRNFDGANDLAHADMVLTAIDDVPASREICVLCRTLKIPVNVADVPPSCDFYFGSQVRRGPLQIMVSTNGNGPKLANLIKRRIEGALPENVGQAIENVGMLRKRLRQRAPGVGGDLGKRRMKWMTSICDAWPINDLALLDEDTMERLLDEGWEHHVVLRPRDILPTRQWSSIRQYWPPQGVASFGAGFITGLLAATTLVLISAHRGSH